MTIVNAVADELGGSDLAMARWSGSECAPPRTGHSRRAARAHAPRPPRLAGCRSQRAAADSERITTPCPADAMHRHTSARGGNSNDMTTPDRAAATAIAVAVFASPVVGRGYSLVSKRLREYQHHRAHVHNR